MIEPLGRESHRGFLLRGLWGVLSFIPLFVRGFSEIVRSGLLGVPLLGRMFSAVALNDNVGKSVLVHL